MSMIQAEDGRPDVGRAYALAVCIAAVLLVVLLRLWFLQIATGQALLAASEANRTRTVRQVGPRGPIVDSRGRVLATTRPRVVVSLVPDSAKRNPPVIPLLAKFLGMQPIEIETVLREDTIAPFTPVRIAVDVPMRVVTRIEERRGELPGVEVGPEAVRTYPDGEMLGHVIGQMGQITREDLDSGWGRGYQGGDSCGKLGVERAFDRQLRGTDGGLRLAVDARGRILKELDIVEPKPGATLELTIDRDLQELAYSELASHLDEGRPGAAVAMDPETGAVLALSSAPSYDPNLFAVRIPKREWSRLREDPLHPLIHRAVGSGYAPGSTFKMITAAAGLATGKTSVHDTAVCRGYITLGKWKKRCHKRSGHGVVNLEQALVHSCDVFFYQLARRLGPERLAQEARNFGLGERTGIELPGVEAAGIVPTPEWKRKRYNQPWYGGETADYGIGQAMLAATPLQMCRITAAIANGGRLLRPQLARRVLALKNHGEQRIAAEVKPEVVRQVALSPTHLETIRAAMLAVVERGTGTVAKLPGIQVAGKTGTAQMVRNRRMVDNAWFVGYAPADRPKIAVCVFVEAAGHGGEIAAPIARRIMAKYLGVSLPQDRPSVEVTQ